MDTFCYWCLIPNSFIILIVRAIHRQYCLCQVATASPKSSRTNIGDNIVRTTIFSFLGLSQLVHRDSLGGMRWIIASWWNLTQVVNTYKWLGSLMKFDFTSYNIVGLVFPLNHWFRSSMRQPAFSSISARQLSIVTKACFIVWQKFMDILYLSLDYCSLVFVSYSRRIWAWIAPPLGWVRFVKKSTSPPAVALALLVR